MLYNWLSKITIVSCLLLLALPAAAQKVSESELTSTSIEVNGASLDIFCYEQQPGNAVDKGSFLKFTSFSRVIIKLKKKISRASASNVTALKSKLRTAKKSKRAGLTACGGSGGGGGGNNSGSYFTTAGDVSDLGRSTFGIPSGLAANVTVGQGLHRTYCTGCHEERRELTFNALRDSISQDPMNYDASSLSDANLAPIMAYLSRFRLPPN